MTRHHSNTRLRAAYGRRRRLTSTVGAAIMMTAAAVASAEEYGTRFYTGLNEDSLLLGAGRKDESGDFTKGASLSPNAIARVIAFTQAGGKDRSGVCSELERLVGESIQGKAGVNELREIDAILGPNGYEAARVAFDPSIVRGLAYYTGPVVEAELTFKIRNEKNEVVQFGAVASGGRYDDLEIGRAHV